MSHEAQISRNNPTAFLFIVDQSGSMSDRMAIGKSKAEFVSDALNRTLMNLIGRCTKSEGVRDYFEVGVIGYGGRGVDNGFSGALGSRVINPMSAIEQNPTRVEDRKKKMDDGAGGIIETSIKFPVWFEPRADGGTPMRAALTKAAEELAAWCDAHPESYPPTIMHVTDGESGDGDPEEIASSLGQLRTNDGTVVVMNAHVSALGADIIRFQDIISLVAGEPFTIENPYIWKTKADVVKVITEAGCHDLIAHSMTCTHTWEMTNQHTHCGGCSQCIDRRFAVLAAKADQYDPVDHYKFDVFTQSRDAQDEKKNVDKIMAAAYLERANQVKGLTNVAQFVSSYPDVGRVFKFLNYNSAGQAAQRVFELYKRHANEVMGALDELLGRHRTAIRERTLPGDCLLQTAYQANSVISMPAVVSAEKQPENFFRKRGAVWETRFQGRNTICLINVDKGAEYINLLLAFPDRESSVYEIAVGSAANAIDLPANTGVAPEDIEEGFQVTQGIPLGDAGDVADRQALREWQQRARELLSEIEEAREAGDQVRIEEIEEEMAFLTKAMEGGKGLGGRQRKAGDKRKNVRDAFRNAVDRAIKQIEKYDKPLAEHLKDTIKISNEVAYRPGMPITWDVRPIVNG